MGVSGFGLAGEVAACADLAQFCAAWGAFGAHPLSPRFAFERAGAAAGKALQLDDELSEAHSAAGFVKMQAAQHGAAGRQNVGRFAAGRVGVPPR